MPEPRRHALRIVVQHLGNPQRYRVVAYGDAAVYAPLEFTSRAATVNAVRHLGTEINAEVLPQDETVSSRIVFTADVHVTESQLRDAGLTRNA